MSRVLQRLCPWREGPSGRRGQRLPATWVLSAGAADAADLYANSRTDSSYIKSKLRNVPKV